VLVWRRHHDVMHRVVEDAEVEALTRVVAGTAFASLCEHHDAETVAAWLVRWTSDGLLRGAPI
jgi:hypothetical protein